jgi:hypothetical protein
VLVEQVVDLVIQKVLEFKVQMETHLHSQLSHQQVVVDQQVLEDQEVEPIMVVVQYQHHLVMLEDLIHLKEILEEIILEQVQQEVLVLEVVVLQLQVLEDQS